MINLCTSTDFLLCVDVWILTVEFYFMIFPISSNLGLSVLPITLGLGPATRSGGPYLQVPSLVLLLRLSNPFSSGGGNHLGKFFILSSGSEIFNSANNSVSSEIPTCLLC